MELKPKTMTRLYYVGRNGDFDVEPVPSRDVDAHAAKVAANKHAIGFRYSTQDYIVAPDGGAPFTRPERRDAKAYYFGVEGITTSPDADILRQAGVPEFLISQAEILCRDGSRISMTEDTVPLTAFAGGVSATRS